MTKNAEGGINSGEHKARSDQVWRSEKVKKTTLSNAVDRGSTSCGQGTHCIESHHYFQMTTIAGSFEHG